MMRTMSKFNAVEWTTWVLDEGRVEMAAEVGDGAMADTLTGGSIPSLHSKADLLIDENGGYYRDAQIFATLSELKGTGVVSVDGNRGCR